MTVCERLSFFILWAWAGDDGLERGGSQVSFDLKHILEFRVSLLSSSGNTTLTRQGSIG